MAGINKVILIGNLGKDPEVKFFPDGGAFCNCTLATSESWTDKQTGEKKERTDWHNIVFTKKIAEIVGQYCRKGSKIYVEGKLQTRKWEKDGVSQYTTEVRVDQVQLLDSKPSGGEAPRTDKQVNQQRAAAKPAPEPEFNDDDIPFN